MIIGKNGVGSKGTPEAPEIKGEAEEGGIHRGFEARGKAWRGRRRVGPSEEARWSEVMELRGDGWRQVRWLVLREVRCDGKWLVLLEDR